jgi:lipoprotein-releasing system permease protein
LRFELFIASRYLRAKRRQAVIGVITAISIIGVAAGVASLVIALAITNGFRQDLQENLLRSSAHVQLMRTMGDGIRDWPALLARLEKIPHVFAAAPAIYEPVMISRGAQAKGALLKGIVPKYERGVSELLTTVKQGSAEPLSVAQPSAAGNRLLPPIVLGKDLADGINANVGSIVLVTSPQGDVTPLGLVPKFVRFRVAGIFQSGFYDYDSNWGFISLPDAQRLFALGDLISVIEFKIDNIFRAGEVGRAIEQAAGPGFQTTDWIAQNKQLFSALKTEQLVTAITIGLIVLVAALNILITLIMMVMEKTRDIAVLMSMGARKRQVRRIFIAQGVLIGIIGTAVGLVVGYVLSWAGGHYHLISLPPAIYSIDYVPFAPRALDGLAVAAVAIGISFIATIYPSAAASRIYPAEALRYE